MAEYKPYLEVSEEVLIRFRTDLAGMSLIREGLTELAANPRGLDEDETQNSSRDAEELLVAMPASTGSRRSPEARLRATINARRQETRRQDQEFDRLSAIVERIEAELPDVVQAAREAVDGSSTTPSAPSPNVTDETAGGAAPSAPSEPAVDAATGGRE